MSDSSLWRMGLIGTLIFIPTVHGEPIFDDPLLNSFISDMLDPNRTRHYELASKQLAIHKWLVRGCMADLGFDDEARSNPDGWSQALYGKYAYCQDHHIPGVDPPCPSENIVELSVNGSCYQRSYDQIDWSSAIMHTLKKDMPDDQWRPDPLDVDISAIESEWSTCMRTYGYQYQTRVDMYTSFGTATDLSAEERADLPDETEVRMSAEHCFERTNYYQKRSDLAKSRRDDYFIRQKKNVELIVQRYENAERNAEEIIQKLCETDKGAIVAMYEEEKYTEKGICTGSR
ncbi:MAG: hypothetical protein KTR32_28240 [Granulosicoccus sp.]|nr:hypothetical protein [Granulosicoccus sp.]